MNTPDYYTNGYTNGTAPRGYEALKAAAKAHRVNIPDLLVLARQNDPFLCGTPTQLEQAHWFADLWQRLGLTTGVHLRKMHYRLVSQHAPRMHNGDPYENTERCWEYLLNAGKQARYLGLVAADAFVDRRNDDPIVYTVYGERMPRTVTRPDWLDYESFDLPSIDADPGWNLSLNVPQVNVTGYEYTAAEQPYHLEIWCEKTTMNDVLLPICQEHGVNLQTGSGFLSITSVVDLLKRVRAGGKPARVFYISDFDPAGDGMPVAVARQIEYWLAEYAPEAEIALQPLVLTRDQARDYRLPRIPIKETDRRRGNFEDLYGAGAVELDALEALYPGELERIVTEAIAPYRDVDLARRYYVARLQAERQARAEWQRATQDEQAVLEVLEQEARAIVNGYTEQLATLAAALERDLAPIAERLEIVRQAIQEKADDFDPDLPPLPDPAAPGQDESNWLFDSLRGYFEQLEHYKQRKVADDGV